MARQRDDVIRMVVELLLAGTFPPGTVFSENDLLKRLERNGLTVSRTPVREALAILVRDRILEQMPQVGLSLHVADAQEIEHVLRARTGLETMVVETLSRLDHPERLRDVEVTLERMEAAVAAGDPRSFADADTDFHCQLAQNTGVSHSDSPPSGFGLVGQPDHVTVAELLRLMRTQIRIAQLSRNLTPEAMHEAVKEHRDLLGAIERRDVADARMFVERHMLHTRGRLFPGQQAVDPKSDVKELIEQGRRHRRRDGDLRQATRLLHCAVDLADNSGLLAEDSELRDLQRKALLELAATRRHREDYANATDFARRADVLATNDDAKAAVRYEEGRIALDTGQSPEGEEKLQQALRLWDTLASGGYREEEAWALYALAEKRHVEKRHDEAIDLARQVLRLFRSANDAYGAANIHQRWGLYLRTKAELLDPRPGEDAAGTLREAKEHTDKAEAMAREHGFPLIEARAILERGFLACLDSDRHRADQCAETARRLFLNLDYARGLAQVERLCEKLRSP